MSIFFNLLKKEVMEAIRTRRLLIFLILFLFIAISSPILAKLMPYIFKSIPTEGMVISFEIPEPTWRDALAQFIKNISQLAAIVLVFAFAGAVSEEKNRKTLELVMVRPLSRFQFVVAKFIGSYLALLTPYLLACLVFYLYTMSVFSAMPVIPFLSLVACGAGFLTYLVSLTVFGSVMFRSQLVTAGLVLVVYTVVSAVIALFESMEKYLPSYALGRYNQIMGGESFLNYLPSIIVSIVISLILVIIGFYIFRSQEIER